MSQFPRCWFDVGKKRLNNRKRLTPSMIHKNLVKPTLSITTTIILFTSLIFIIDPVYAEETTEIGLIAASDTISVGEEFMVTLYINPTVEVGGWMIYQLSFSEEYVTANSVTSGFEWSESFDEGSIDNSDGIITDIQCWKMESYPSENHTACTISFTAINSGVCRIELVSVQVTDTLFKDLSVSTNNVTVAIQGNGDGDGDGDANQPPIANASASETSGFVGMYIQFNGSLSYDTDDGYIKSWQWDFGNGETGDGETTKHIYHEADNYTVTLTVTDDKGATDTDAINVIIIPGANIPPKKPVVTGPLSGHMDIPYEYTANATDLDNDTISYIFNWGDQNINKTEFLSINKSTTQTHIWSVAGRYIVSVEVTDNQTYSQPTELTVMIDALDVDDIGYITDDDGDEIYDTFHDYSEEIITDLGQDVNGNYLIDVNGNGEWDYIFDSDTGILEEYIIDDNDDNSTPFIGITGVIFLIMFFVYIRKKRFS